MELFFGMLFGALGTAYLVYGKRQHDALFLITGFILIIYPYLFSNPVVILLIGLVAAAFPIAHARGYF
jgi:hypothetical protein